MKVRLLDIPEDGITIQTTLPLANLTARMAEGGGADIQFTEDPQVDAVIHKEAGGANIIGSAKAAYLQPCGRCTDGVPRIAEVRIDFELQPLPDDYTGPSSGYEDDVGLIYYEGDEIDLEPIVYESLMLSLSIYWSPPEKDDGSCSVCGQRIQETVTVGEGKASLGELLKKAGLN